MGQGKYDMEVCEGENLAFSFFKPTLPWHVLTFRTVAISAGVIDNSDGAAVIAAIDMAAQMRGTTV